MSVSRIKTLQMEMVNLRTMIRVRSDKIRNERIRKRVGVCKRVDDRS